MLLLKHIDVVPNFPKEGINFYDIQSVLKKPEIWETLVDALAARVRAQNPDIILGIEARGFLTGLPIAQKLKRPFMMVRKAGKLPGKVIAQSYDLEYGSDCIEIQGGIMKTGARVAIMDDLLATGGTMKATGDLIRKAGGDIVIALCIIELYELKGREQLNFPFEALLQAPLNPRD